MYPEFRELTTHRPSQSSSALKKYYIYVRMKFRSGCFYLIYLFITSAKKVDQGNASSADMLRFGAPDKSQPALNNNQYYYHHIQQPRAPSINQPSEQKSEGLFPLLLPTWALLHRLSYTIHKILSIGGLPKKGRKKLFKTAPSFFPLPHRFRDAHLNNRSGVFILSWTCTHHQNVLSSGGGVSSSSSYRRPR